MFSLRTEFVFALPRPPTPTMAMSSLSLGGALRAPPRISFVVMNTPAPRVAPAFRNCLRRIIGFS